MNLKTKPDLGNVVSTIAALLLAANAANAQAPSSVAGDSILASVSDGTYPFGSYGYYIFLPANSGSAYQIIDIYAFSSSSGTYGYSATGPSTGVLSFNDSLVGAGNLSASFDSSSSGSFYATANSFPGAYQNGTFDFASINAPSTIVGRSFVASIYDGQYPFAYMGSFTFHAAASGNSYTIVGDGSSTANSSGTYTYSLANRSTGKLVINDTVVGAATVYVGFTDPTEGGYAATQPSTSGFQVGTFVFLDTIPPTVSITSPPGAKTYTSPQTVSIGATASDNVSVAFVDFYDGATLKGRATIAPYAFDWSFTAADNGAHGWTARAYDNAGNAKTSSPVMLTVSIDITPPTVSIAIPTNGTRLTTSPITVSGTASDPGSPSSGLSLVQVRLNGGNWTNATGSTSWSRSLTISPCGNTIEARSLDKAGNYSAIASNFITYTPPNTVPNTPSNLSPPGGSAGVSVTPTLGASAFSDPDPICLGDTHAASQWQLLSAGGVTVVDSGTDTVNKVSWLVPTNKLSFGSNYQWHVRYQDSRNGWSSYSTITRFTNGGPMLVGLPQGTNIVLKWPTNAPAFALQWSTSLVTTNWSNATPAAVIVSGQYTVTNSATNAARFYRLRK